MGGVALLAWRLVSAAAGPAAAAATDGTTFALDYRAAPGCPDEASFEAALVARTRAARRVELTEEAWARFEIVLDDTGAQRPRLRVTLADGTRQDREVTADGCAEAMESMAIIAAMVLEAQSTPPAAEPTPTEPASPNPVTPQPEPEPALRHAATATTPAPKHSPRGTWLTAVLGLVAESGAAPKPGFGATIGGELGSRARGLLAPSLRLSLLGAQPEIVESPAGDARFRLLLARVHGCALRLGSDSASLRFCALFEAGALSARGIGALNQRSHTMPWLGVGFGAFGQLGLRGPFALELGGAVRDLLVHDEFVFSPGQEVHQVPVIAWNFSLCATYRVW